MDNKTVSLTVLVSIDVVADTKSQAEDIARRFFDGLVEGASDGFMDGWNSVENEGEVLDIRFDIEGEAEVEEIEGG